MIYTSGIGKRVWFVSCRLPLVSIVSFRISMICLLIYSYSSAFVRLVLSLIMIFRLIFSTAGLKCMLSTFEVFKQLYLFEFTKAITFTSLSEEDFP